MILVTSGNDWIIPNDVIINSSSEAALCRILENSAISFEVETVASLQMKFLEDFIFSLKEFNIL